MEKLDINGKLQTFPVYTWKKTTADKGWPLRKLVKAELPSGDYDNVTYLRDMNEGSCILYLRKFLDAQNNVWHEVNHQT